MCKAENIIHSFDASINVSRIEIENKILRLLEIHETAYTEAVKPSKRPIRMYPLI